MPTDVASGTEGAGWEDSVDVIWLFVCVVLVIIMQAGFAAYEVSPFQVLATKLNILFMDAA